MLKDKKVMLPVLFCDILVLISYFIYAFLPKSVFANDVSRPGMTAVYVFAVAPVLCFVAAVASVVFFKKSKQVLDASYKSVISVTACTVSVLLYIVCFVLELLYLISQISLGFLAPMTGTVYETYATVILVGSIIHLVVWSVLFIKLRK